MLVEEYAAVSTSPAWTPTIRRRASRRLGDRPAVSRTPPSIARCASTCSSTSRSRSSRARWRSSSACCGPAASCWCRCRTSRTCSRASTFCCAGASSGPRRNTSIPAIGRPASTSSLGRRAGFDARRPSRHLSDRAGPHAPRAPPSPGARAAPPRADAAAARARLVLPEPAHLPEALSALPEDSRALEERHHLRARRRRRLRSSISCCSASTSPTSARTTTASSGSSAAWKSSPRSSSASASTARSCGSSTSATTSAGATAREHDLLLPAGAERRAAGALILGAAVAGATLSSAPAATRGAAADAAEHVRDRLHVHPVPRAADGAALDRVQPDDAGARRADDPAPPGARDQRWAWASRASSSRTCSSRWRSWPCCPLVRAAHPPDVLDGGPPRRARLRPAARAARRGAAGHRRRRQVHPEAFYADAADSRGLLDGGVASG